MDYSSVLKRNDIVTCVTVWVDIMLSEISPSQADKYFMTPLT